MDTYTNTTDILQLKVNLPTWIRDTLTQLGPLDSVVDFMLECAEAGYCDYFNSHTYPYNMPKVQVTITVTNATYIKSYLHRPRSVPLRNFLCNMVDTDEYTTLPWDEYFKRDPDAADTRQLTVTLGKMHSAIRLLRQVRARYNDGSHLLSTCIECLQTIEEELNDKREQADDCQAAAASTSDTHT